MARNVFGRVMSRLVESGDRALGFPHGRSLSISGIGNLGSVVQPRSLEDHQCSKEAAEAPSSSSDSDSDAMEGKADAADGDVGNESVNKDTGEIGGPQGPEPTRYGDWERGGRCSDF